MDAQEHFDRYFEGDWKLRRLSPWRLFHVAPRLMRISTYSSGEVSDGVVAVHGKADDGTRVTFKVRPSDTTISGYERVSAPTHDQPPTAASLGRCAE